MEWITSFDFGSGGVSKETYNLVNKLMKIILKKFMILGFVEDEKYKIGNKVIGGYEVVTCDDEVIKYASQFPVIGFAIPIGNPN